MRTFLLTTEYQELDNPPACMALDALRNINSLLFSGVLAATVKANNATDFLKEGLFATLPHQPTNTATINGHNAVAAYGSNIPEELTFLALAGCMRHILISAIRRPFIGVLLSFIGMFSCCLLEAAPIDCFHGNIEYTITRPYDQGKLKLIKVVEFSLLISSNQYFLQTIVAKESIPSADFMKLGTTNYLCWDGTNCMHALIVSNAYISTVEPTGMVSRCAGGIESVLLFAYYVDSPFSNEFIQNVNKTLFWDIKGQDIVVRSNTNRIENDSPSHIWYLPGYTSGTKKDGTLAQVNFSKPFDTGFVAADFKGFATIINEANRGNPIAILNRYFPERNAKGTNDLYVFERYVITSTNTSVESDSVIQRTITGTFQVTDFRFPGINNAPISYKVKDSFCLNQGDPSLPAIVEKAKADQMIRFGHSSRHSKKAVKTICLIAVLLVFPLFLYMKMGKQKNEK